MEPIEDDFFARLKAVIQQERVPYRAGAWESFKNQEKQTKRALLFPMISAAAVIVMCCMIYFWPQADHFVEVKQKITSLRTGQSATGAAQPKRAQAITKKIVLKKNRRPPYQIKKEAVTQTPGTVAERLAASIGSGYAEANEIAQDVKEKVKQGTRNNNNKPYNPIANERPNLAMRFDQGSSWKISAALNNSYNAADRLTFGVAAAVDVHITKRIALTSGIGYNQLASKKTSDNSMMGAADMEKTLASVYTSVSGIDIPLEIKYSLNKNTAIGFGLSAMAVLKQHQTRNYIDTKIVVSSYTDEQGEVRTESRTVVENTKETVRNDDLSANDYLGFYNLSIGRHQKISNKQYITIEPFVKLPMHSFSSEKVKLISGGIRLKVDL
ncbi:PorT family protein [Pedobacter hiemivivus]|uniref:PorT family protein n=1 Tax=Pedobacter hiemivivus TaxID=2530454 RepID=A0A4R0N8Q4_9SPHI|nr:outer membrane beta-barrel protein [Pedobacter hiemivivus]TCC96521.1 hypothetical protein EZ444_11105 [Pedobacter hiemivivus]TKC57170.1 PorT family protein [Pedobacter hiemivivus]